VKLYLVRHAAATIRPELPSSQWHLSPEGRAGAEALAQASLWSDVRGIHTSAEPKAAATAQRIAARHGLPMRIQPELREVERPWTEGDYAHFARSYLAGGAIDGWEPREQALARVRRSIDGIVAQHDGADAGIVSHGLALGLYLSDLLALDTVTAWELWSGMRFPDLAILDLDSCRLERSFGAS
jgi:broad specificity phosphatase PhoE